jgi:large subunit ribosomal protein L10
MKLKRSEKDQLVTDLKAQLAANPIVYVTDFTGLAVKAQTDLRRRLRGVGVQYVVVKNTLAERALDATQVAALADHLAGPTAFAMATEPVAGAKVLSAFAKEHESFRVKAALVEGRALTAAEIMRLATLPSRTQLLAELGGVMQAPMAGFAGALNGLLMNMVGALEALRVQRENAA